MPDSNQPRPHDPPGEKGAAPANQADYDERIRVLRKSLADVQKPETLKSRTGRNLLAHAELMFDILDAIKELHSFVGVATLPFRATLKIVLVKQDSDKRIAALMVEMIDMMSALIELRNMKYIPRKTATGEFIESNLTRVLEVIKDDIEDAGNLVDCYSKARSWHRVLHVHEWAEKFNSMAESFQRGKTNIQVALGIHTALSVDTKIDHVIVLMREWFARPHCSDERDFLARVQQDGSQKYLESEAAFINLYKETGPRELGRESVSNMSADRQTNDSRERIREAKEEWEEINMPLTKLLSENRTVFEALLEVQKKDLKTVIRQSETTIIKAINEGPHSYIVHPDIRNLWKAMQWRLSVKTRHFVMALHDHYLHGAYATSHGDIVHKADNTAAQSKDDNFESEPFVDPADRWCLRYLRIRYLPAISEAFDDDSSGFIGISEVNDFTEGIPKGWNLLKWVAYWTASWPKELARYSRLIQTTMVQLAEAQCKVKPENIVYVNNYMNGYAFSETKLLVTSVQSETVSTAVQPELPQLAIQVRMQTETYLKNNLETVKYYIDDSDKLPLLCGPGRIEKYLFPLLYLLLVRHLEIVNFASKHVLDSREMNEAEWSLYRVLQKVSQRVEELKESFRQQKFNVNEQFKAHACGMYSRYQSSDARKGVGILLQHLDDDGNDDALDEYPISSSGSESNPEPDESSPQDSSETLFAQPRDNISSLHDDSGAETQENMASVEETADNEEIGPKTASNTSSTDTVVALLPTVTSTAEEKSQISPSPSTPTPEADKSKEGGDPTRFGPSSLETNLYAEPSTLTDDTAPSRPFRVHYSDIGPREMFRMAVQRVMERAQLLSPRLTWDFLKRRRDTRLKWIEIALRPDEQYVGINEWKTWDPSNEQEREDLKAQVMPADIPYYDSLAQLQARLNAVHIYWFCDGCQTQIRGKRFRCLDCPEFDLCDQCEHAGPPKHDVTIHPPSHAMLQISYPVMTALPNWIFANRARKYLIKHAKQQCPCSDAGSTTPSGSKTFILRCGGCQKEMKNEPHFRCVQCPDYDLCEACEQDHPLQHCKAHALLKIKAPFLERKSEDSEDTDDEEQPLSVDDRLDRLTRRMTELENKFGARLDDLTKSFTRAVSLLEKLGAQEK